MVLEEPLGLETLPWASKATQLALTIPLKLVRILPVVFSSPSSLDPPPSAKVPFFGLIVAGPFFRYFNLYQVCIAAQQTIPKCSKLKQRQHVFLMSL